MEDRFVRADTYNLPKVDMLDILEYSVGSQKYNVDEVKAARKLQSYCDGFINLAIGRVEVKRIDGVCTVKAKLLTGERLRKPYAVSCEMDEKNDRILNTGCEECDEEDINGCRHSLLLLDWLRIRHSEPPPESTRCFWAKPILSPIFTEPATLKDLFPGAKKRKLPPKDPSILKRFFKECEKRGLTGKDSLILNYKPSFDDDSQ